LNRFREDVGNLDDALPRTLFDALQGVAWSLAAVSVAAAANAPVLAAAVPLLAAGAGLRRSSRSSRRCVQQLAAASRRSVHGHLADVLHGAVAVRAARRGARVRASVWRALDAHSRAHLAVGAHARWLGYEETHELL
jgi:ABC-type transport system involved in cytochrome bd biosynthesis fused ATPase/permease subunit